MIEQSRGTDPAQVVRRSDALLRSYLAKAAFQIREKLHSEQYRREREKFPQWIDVGGEA